MDWPDCRSRIAPCRHQNKSPSRRISSSTPSPPARPARRWCCCCTALRNRCIAGAPRSPALGDMGYRAIAPSQRGYSPGARPDPREFSHYLIDRLMDDAMAIVAAAGYGECALSSRRPRLGRQHRLGHRRPPPRAAGLAHHSLAAASERVQSRADEPTASRRSARSTTRRFWSPMPPMSCWPTTPNGCASV